MKPLKIFKRKLIKSLNNPVFSAILVAAQKKNEIIYRVILLLLKDIQQLFFSKEGVESVLKKTKVLFENPDYYYFRDRINFVFFIKLHFKLKNHI